MNGVQLGGGEGTGGEHLSHGTQLDMQLQWSSLIDTVKWSTPPSAMS